MTKYRVEAHLKFKEIEKNKVNVYYTEQRNFESKNTKHPFKDMKLKSLGFYPEGKNQRKWLPLYANIAVIELYDDSTGELLERIESEYHKGVA